jgi:hypothetical protein
MDPDDSVYYRNLNDPSILVVGPESVVTHLKHENCNTKYVANAGVKQTWN